jgi:hypothetical protein
MHAEQAYRDELTTCPKCCSEIRTGASVCPVCRSNIHVKTQREKTRERISTTARFLKDWVGFPAAVVAALAALARPAVLNILWLLGQDGASLEFKLLRPDYINVGLDDVPIATQGERVDIAIPFYRAALINNGASPAAVRSQFRCSTGSGSEETGGNFYFFDLSTQRKIMNDIEVAAGGTAFVNVALSAAGSPRDGYPKTKHPESCEFEYSDKYGVRPPFEARHDVKRSPLMALGRAEDRRVSAREVRCKNMAQGISLGTEPIDCVSMTHLFAIEPVHLWERALSRALRQVAEFQRVSSGVQLSLGLILNNCDNELCVLAHQQLATSLQNFKPAVSVWICENEAEELDRCAKTQYPSAP